MIITEQVTSGQKLIKNVFSSNFLILLKWEKSIDKEIEQNSANAYFLQTSNVIFNLKTYKTYL